MRGKRFLKFLVLFMVVARLLVFVVGQAFLRVVTSAARAVSWP